MQMIGASILDQIIDNIEVEVAFLGFDQFPGNASQHGVDMKSCQPGPYRSHMGSAGRA